MNTPTLAPDTAAPPDDRRAFLRLALLMAGTVAVISLTGTFSTEKLSFLYKDQLHLTAGGMASLAILLLLPNYLRPFIGAGSDFFPLLGYHRRSYYALAALLNALGFFGLSALPHYAYLTTALLVIVTVAGSVTLMIMADAVMVMVGNRTGTVGRIQAVQQFTPYLLSLLFAARLGGYVTQHWSDARCFRTAALIALLALPLTFLIDEKRSRGPRERETPDEHAARLEATRAERAQTAAALRQAARTPGLWAVVAYVFYLIFTPGTSTAQFYYSVDSLHFSKQFLGSLGQFAAAGVLLGILLFAAISRNLPVAAFVWGAWALDCSGYLLNFGLHDALSAKIVTFAGAFLGSFYSLSLLTLAARACPPHVEGTVYGLFVSALGLAGTLGNKVGGTLYDFYGPAHAHTTAHAWHALNGWGLALTIPAALLILLLPAWAKAGSRWRRLRRRDGYNEAMNTPALLVYVYAALVSLGGVMGFVKARSLPSLIAGEIGFLALVAAGYGLGHGLAWGLPLALVLMLGLLVFFAVRYVRTRALMPGGLMAILSLLALAGVLVTSRPHP